MLRRSKRKHPEPEAPVVVKSKVQRGDTNRLEIKDALDEMPLLLIAPLRGMVADYAQFCFSASLQQTHDKLRNIWWPSESMDKYMHTILQCTAESESNFVILKSTNAFIQALARMITILFVSRVFFGKIRICASREERDVLTHALLHIQDQTELFACHSKKQCHRAVFEHRHWLLTHADGHRMEMSVIDGSATSSPCDYRFARVGRSFVFNPPSLWGAKVLGTSDLDMLHK